MGHDPPTSLWIWPPRVRGPLLAAGYLAMAAIYHTMLQAIDRTPESPARGGRALRVALAALWPLTLVVGLVAMARWGGNED
jgi:hypothetical protein